MSFVYSNDQTDIWAAVQAGDLTNVQEILDHSDDHIMLDDLDPGGCTALGMSALQGNDELVKLLIQRGAKVNHPDFYGQTALHYATENGHPDVAWCLIQAGADVNWSSFGGNGLTALHVAACKGRCDVTRVLIEGRGNVDAKDNNGVTVLHCAVANGHLDVAEYLVTSGANTNACGLTTGRSPLFLACEIQRLDMVKLLVKKKAKVNITDNYGMSPLCVACLQNQTQLAEFLLESGSKVNTADHRGNTPLFYTARNGNSILILQLLQKGNMVNAVNRDGLTALHVAIQMQHTETAKILLQHGAHTDASEVTSSPLLEAVQNYQDSKEFIKLLQEFLDYNTNMDVIDPRTGTNALYAALHLNKEEIAKCLIQYGASVNVDCPLDQSVLYKACQKGFESTVELILCSDIDWTREAWLHSDIHSSGINPKLLRGYTENVPMILLGKIDLFRMILNRRFNARTLGDICRIVIRKRLRCLWRTVGSLGLPRRVCEYLMLK